MISYNAAFEGYQDGIRYSETGEATAYKTFAGEYVPASSVLHVGEPTRANQLRFFPPITPAINNCFDAKELDQLAKQGFKLQLAIPMLVQKASATGNSAKERTLGPQSAPTTADTSAQEFQDVTGAVLLDLPMGSKVDMHSPAYPGPLYTVFKESLMRDACVAVSWSYDFLVTTNLGGTPQRAAIEKTKARAEVIQDTIAWPVFRRAMLHWLAWAIETGLVPAVDNWWAVGYRKPRDMSIDLGRDTRAILDEVGRLLMSPDEYFALYSQTPAEEFAKGAAALNNTPDEYRKLFILKNYGPESAAMLGLTANNLQQNA
jgi:capsid protein